MTVKNHTIFTRDNLEVMRGMADESVDLIYWIRRLIPNTITPRL